MAISSGILVANIVDTFDSTQLAWDPTACAASGAGAWKAAGLGVNVAPNFYQDVGYATTTYTNNEVTGGANWTTGGRLLYTAASGGGNATPTLTATSTGGGTLKYDLNDFLVDTVTFSTAIYGVLIYESNLGSKNGLVVVSFGGSGYTTGGGQFGIVWPTDGVFAIDMVP